MNQPHCARALSPVSLQNGLNVRQYLSAGSRAVQGHENAAHEFGSGYQRLVSRADKQHRFARLSNDFVCGASNRPVPLAALAVRRGGNQADVVPCRKIGYLPVGRTFECHADRLNPCVTQAIPQLRREGFDVVDVRVALQVK